MTERLACLIDSNNYIFRAFFGMPSMHAPDGTPVHATYGFARTVLKLLGERQPDYVAAVFERGPSFRTELYADYKANRDEPPEDLVPQFDSARQVAAALGLHCLEVDGFEADDLIGTLATQLRRQGIRVIIVSSDKDLAQLVDDGITLLDIAKDRELDADGVLEVFGVRPEQIVDYLALAGDSVDNIPGVRGVGPKTARALLQATGTVDALLADPTQIESLAIRGRQSVQAKIIDSTEVIHLSRELATIRRDVPLTIKPEEIYYHGASHQQTAEIFDRLGFGRRIREAITRWADAPATTGRLDL